jgi:hypothetical protein
MRRMARVVGIGRYQVRRPTRRKVTFILSSPFAITLLPMVHAILGIRPAR